MYVKKLHKKLCRNYTWKYVFINQNKTKQTHMFEKWFPLKLLLLCDLNWIFWQKKMTNCISFINISTIWKKLIRWLWFWWICYIQDSFKVHFAFKCHIWICVNFCRQFARFFTFFCRLGLSAKLNTDESMKFESLIFLKSV